MKSIYFLLFVLCSSIAVSQEFEYQQRITPMDWNHRDEFGGAVAIDGRYAIAGARYHDFDENGSNEVSGAGAAFIFRMNAKGEWEEIQKLAAPDREMAMFFGYSVDISGKYAIVGSIYDILDENGEDELYNAGSAFIYERTDDTTWVLRDKVVASNRKRDGQFGSSVSICANGDALVGGHKNANFGIHGSLYFFQKNGSSWNLTSTNNGRAGWDTDIHEDMAVSGYESGSSIFVLKQNNPGSWVTSQTINPPNTNSGDNPGASVSISEEWLAIGADFEDEDENNTNEIWNAGAVYMYRLNAQGDFEFFQKLLSPNRQISQRFGFQVSVDNQTLAVGLPYDQLDYQDSNEVINAGSVMIFDFDQSANEWVFTSKHSGFQRRIDDWFGYSLDLSNNTFIAGIPNTRESGNSGAVKNDAGGAYLFKRCVAAPNIDISASGALLTTTNKLDYHQWYNCDDEEIVDNANDSVFGVWKPGNYALIGVKDGCIDTSTCIAVETTTGLLEHGNQPTSFYPNPAASSVTFSGESPAQLTFVSMDGKVLKTIKAETNSNLQLGTLPSGIYWVRISTEKGLRIEKLVKL